MYLFHLLSGYLHSLSILVYSPNPKLNSSVSQGLSVYLVFICLSLITQHPSPTVSVIQGPSVVSSLLSVYLPSLKHPSPTLSVSQGPLCVPSLSLFISYHPASISNYSQRYQSARPFLCAYSASVYLPPLSILVHFLNTISNPISQSSPFLCRPIPRLQAMKDAQQMDIFC